MERPATLCHLKKDQLIDTQENFVDTFNWMVDFINNLKGDGDDDKDKKIKVDKSTSDHPIIKFSDTDLSSSSSIRVEGNDGSFLDNVRAIKFVGEDDLSANPNLWVNIADGGDGVAVAKIVASIRLEGNDGSYLDGIRTIKFRSEPDTNLSVNIADDTYKVGAGFANIGVYYK